MNEINPRPRFTGLFIPAEIMEIEELTLFEVHLLSWIDALYCKEHGGCFASNEYLASKMRGAKENTVAKALTHLRHLGLIEDVAFDGRRRVIRALIGRNVDERQSKAALDLNPTQGWTKIQPSIGQKSKGGTPSPYIDKKGDIKDKKGGHAPQPPPSPASSKKKKEEKIPRAEHVATSNEEHAKLVSEYGEPLVQQAYKELSEWKLDKEKSRWRKNDYLSVRRWAIEAAQKRLPSPSSAAPPSLSPAEWNEQRQLKREKYRDYVSAIREKLGPWITKTEYVIALGSVAEVCSKTKDYRRHVDYDFSDFKERLKEHLLVVFPQAREVINGICV